ncbi:MAG TPA: macro domain-containing protein [Candidatus Limnocylindria bacterium]
MRIEVKVGDIAEQPDLEAVVNAANTELWMGTGVAGALKRRGGPEIEKAAIAQGPIAMGEAVLTTGGRLPNRHVIHVAALGFRPQDGPPTAETIARGTASALAICAREGVWSVGFPALGTGVGSFPLDQCATAMLGAVRAHMKARPDLVRFVLRDERAGEVFRRAVSDSARP